MSGEPRRIVLVGDDDAFLARAVETLDGLPSDLPRWAVVGGLGVDLRIGDVHRGLPTISTRSVRTAGIVLHQVETGPPISVRYAL